MNEGAEKRKFELVCAHLEKASEERAELLIARYLDTAPAPEYAEKIKARFGKAWAGASVLHRAQAKALRADEELLELLSFRKEGSPESFGQAGEWLSRLAESIPDVERVVHRTLKEGKEGKELLAAAALSLRLDLSELMSRADLAGLLVVHVVRGSEIAGQMAAFAAKAEPELVQNVFSKFLVNVLLDKNPDPPMEEMAERRAIVAARTMLPLLGSPIPEVGYQDEDAREIAAMTRRAWAFCDAVSAA